MYPHFPQACAKYTDQLEIAGWGLVNDHFDSARNLPFKIIHLVTVLKWLITYGWDVGLEEGCLDTN